MGSVKSEVAAGDAVRTMNCVADALQQDSRLALDEVARPHPLLVAARRTAGPFVGDGHEDHRVVFAQASLWDSAREELLPFRTAFAEGSALLVFVGRPHDPSFGQGVRHAVAAVVDHNATGEEISIAAHRALELLAAKRVAASSDRSLYRHRYELGELLHIARAMTTVRDVDKLLGVILEKSRLVTGADAGSIYIVESQGDGAVLRFKLTQNDSVAFDSHEFTMALSERSIAGSAAIRKHAFNIPDVLVLAQGGALTFDPSFDRKTGYITKSMLAMPLISQRDETIGVIQLIDKKRDPSRISPRVDQVWLGPCRGARTVAIPLLRSGNSRPERVSTFRGVGDESRERSQAREPAVAQQRS